MAGGPPATETEVRGADWYGEDLSGQEHTRVAFSGCRLTGVVFSGAALRDVRITEGRADLALLRMAKARHLWIEDTSLRGADLYGFEGADCAFLGCDLTDAALGDARLPGVLLHGSTVDAVRGAEALRGARIGADQVVPLGAALLAALDITVTAAP